MKFSIPFSTSLVYVILLLVACSGPGQITTVPAPKADMANPASVYCEEHGGTNEIRTEAGGEVGYCRFADGSECEEWAFFRGECAPTKRESPTVEPASCQEVRTIAEEALGRQATVTAGVPFQDPITGKSGSACQATITGTGVDFESPDEVMQKLKAVLGARGWSEDVMYAADGPTGTGTGMINGDQLCLLIAMWIPAGEARCPADRPISECELKPEQQLYTVTLTCTE